MKESDLENAEQNFEEANNRLVGLKLDKIRCLVEELAWGDNFRVSPLTKDTLRGVTRIIEALRVRIYCDKVAPHPAAPLPIAPPPEGQ